MTLNSTVTELLEVMTMDEPFGYLSDLTADLAVFLVHNDCDFYEVMRVLLHQNISACSEGSAEKLYKIVPRHRKLKSLEPGDIHGMIARWTATPYHTGPIMEVVQDIRVKCFRRQAGFHVYNSNLNPNNPKSANDPYLLLVTEDGITFSDLNRKISYHYEMGDEL